jgi:hypothetical protein
MPPQVLLLQGHLLACWFHTIYSHHDQLAFKNRFFLSFISIVFFGQQYITIQFLVLWKALTYPS